MTDASSPRNPIRQDAIAALCRRWQVTECAFLGSVLRADFGPDSDVDAVAFSPEAKHSLVELVRMEDESRRTSGAHTRRTVADGASPTIRQPAFNILPREVTHDRVNLRTGQVESTTRDELIAYFAKGFSGSAKGTHAKSMEIRPVLLSATAGLVITRIRCTTPTDRQSASATRRSWP